MEVRQKERKRNRKLAGGRRLRIRERDTKTDVTSVVHFMVLLEKGHFEEEFLLQSLSEHCHYVGTLITIQA